LGEVALAPSHIQISVIKNRAAKKLRVEIIELFWLTIRLWISPAVRHISPYFAKFHFRSAGALLRLRPLPSATSLQNRHSPYFASIRRISPNRHFDASRALLVRDANFQCR
jgi:hypothetical protein